MKPLSEPLPPVRIVDYGSLLTALNNRRIEMRMSMIELDATAGLADGHASKVFCGLRNFGATSLGLTLGALGCELVLVDTQDKPCRNRLRGNGAGMLQALAEAPLRKRMAEIGRLGGRARYMKMTAAERTEFHAAGGRAKARKAKKAARGAKAWVTRRTTPKATGAESQA